MRLVCSQWPNIKVTSTQTIHRLTAHLFYESLWHPRLFGFSHPSKRSHRTACEISTRLAGPREQTFWNGLLPLNQSWVQVIPQKLTQQKQENKLSSSSKKQHPHGRGGLHEGTHIGYIAFCWRQIPSTVPFGIQLLKVGGVTRRSKAHFMDLQCTLPEHLTQ